LVLFRSSSQFQKQTVNAIAGLSGAGRFGQFKASVMMKRLVLALGVLLVSALAAYADSNTVVVDQKRLRFSLPSVTMKVGDHLRFTNSDDVNHNVLISLGGRRTNSGLQKPGEPFEVPMVREGTYQVTCGIHPRMRMVVVVEN